MPDFNYPFTAVELTQQIDRVPNVWERLEPWEKQYPPTTTVEIQFRDGVVTVLEAAERGEPGPDITADSESSVILKIPHIPQTARIKPEDLQDRWVFESGQKRLLTLADATTRQLLKLRRNHAQTLELLRWGALKGQLISGAGKVLYDFFEVFGATQKTFDLALDDDDTDVEAICDDIRVYLEEHLLGETMDGVCCRVSQTLYRKLTNHPKVKEIYRNWSGSLGLAEARVKGEFLFGGINWIAETHVVSNISRQTVKFLADGTGIAYPTGTSETFQTHFGPAHHIGMTNLPGAEIFVSPEILRHGAGVELRAQSNPLPVCTRPELLVKVVSN